MDTGSDKNNLCSITEKIIFVKGQSITDVKFSRLKFWTKRLSAGTKPEIIMKTIIKNFFFCVQPTCSALLVACGLQAFPILSFLKTSVKTLF